MNPYPTRPQPGGPAAAPYFRYQQAVPAQRLQSSIIRQSHADIDLDPFYNEPPSAEQYKAATILQEIRSDTLKGIRSCLRGEQLFDTNLLSPQQFRAALILKDYPDDALLKLLNLARSPGQYPRNICLLPTLANGCRRYRQCIAKPSWQQ